MTIQTAQPVQPAVTDETVIRREYAIGLQLIVKRLNPTLVGWAVLPDWAGEDEVALAWDSGIEYHPDAAIKEGEYWLDYRAQMLANLRESRI